MKRVIFIMLAFTMLTTAVSFAGTPGKPTPKHLKIVKPIAPVEHNGLKAFVNDDALILLPVLQITVQVGILGAPGSTGTAPCTGTFVTVTETNECGQSTIIQQYWVQSSIHCQSIVN